MNPTRPSPPQPDSTARATRPFSSRHQCDRAGVARSFSSSMLDFGRPCSGPCSSLFAPCYPPLLWGRAENAKPLITHYKMAKVGASSLLKNFFRRNRENRGSLLDDVRTASPASAAFRRRSRNPGSAHPSPRAAGNARRAAAAIRRAWRTIRFSRPPHARSPVSAPQPFSPASQRMISLSSRTRASE
jgi:hypothetical protein